MADNDEERNRQRAALAEAQRILAEKHIRHDGNDEVLNNGENHVERDLVGVQTVHGSDDFEIAGSSMLKMRDREVFETDLNGVVRGSTEDDNVLENVIIAKRAREEEFSAFMKDLDGYSPTVPEAVSQYFLQKGGASTQDPRLLKLISLAADRFMAAAIYDGILYQRARLSSSVNGYDDSKESDAHTNECLQFCDISASLSEQGISICKPI